MRLYALVEGQTEERLFKRLLGPHLAEFGVQATAIIVTTSHAPRTGRPIRGGGRSWAHWKRDLQRLTREHAKPDVRFTTLIDVYAFPRGLVDDSSAPEDAVRVLDPLALEAAMARDVEDWRFIPYVQRHELEALVLASLDGLSVLLDPTAKRGLQALREDIGDFAPEDVDGGRETAPSRRITRHVAGYAKVAHGVAAIEQVGLDAVRRACPRFGAWLGRLERLAGGATD